MRNIATNKFLRGSAIVLGGSVAANALNYAFNLVLGRIMPPAAYGETVLVVTFITLVGTPFTAVRLALASRAAELTALNQSDQLTRVRELSRQFQWRAGAALTLLYLSILPLLAGFFQMRLSLLALLTPLIFLTVANAAVSGLLQGIEDYTSLSVAHIIGALAKLTLSVLLVVSGYSVGGIIGSLIAGTILAYAYSARKVSQAMSGGSASAIPALTLKKLTGHIPPFFGTLMVVTLITAAFTSIDVMLAKHYLTPDTAGAYSALSVLGRIILYGATAVVTVLVPQAVATNTKPGNDSPRVLAHSLLLVAGVSACGLLLFVAAPATLVRLLYGEHYLFIAPQLPLFGLAMFMSAVASVGIHYFIAVRESRMLYPLSAALVVLVAAIALFHRDITEIVYAQVLANAVLLLGLGVVYALYRSRRQT